MQMLKSVTAAVRETVNDGWANILTGLGMANRDKTVSATVFWQQITPDQADELYAGDDLAARIVNTLPEDAMREGYDLEDFGNDDMVKKLEAEKTRLGMDHRIEEIWKIARTQGGGALLMVTDDATDLASPLDLGRVTMLHSLVPLSRRELRATTGGIESDLRSPNFGHPRAYELVPIGDGRGINAGVVVHHTRLVRFDGARLPQDLYRRNQYWHDTVLSRPYGAIRNYNTANDSAAAAIQDFRVAVFKMKGLAQLIGAGKDAEVIKRIQTIQLAKSVARAVITDESESWEEKTTNFAGIPEIIGKMKERVQIAAEGIPHTKLFGESPDGMGGTGRSTEVTWYDTVSSRQEQYLRPKILQIFRVIFAQKKLSLGEYPAEGKISFRPLWQLDEKEQVAMRKDMAATDQIYVDLGVLDPQEVREQRFSENGYSIETAVTGEAPPPPNVPPPGGGAGSGSYPFDDGATLNDRKTDGGPGSGPQGGGGEKEGEKGKAPHRVAQAENGQIKVGKPKSIDEANAQLGEMNRIVGKELDQHEKDPHGTTGGTPNSLRVQHATRQLTRAVSNAKPFMKK